MELDMNFRDGRSVAPLPVYFPYGLTKHHRFWGMRISCLPFWFLRKAFRDLDTLRVKGLRSALYAEMGSRSLGMAGRLNYGL